MGNATFQDLPRMVHDLQREIHELKKMVSTINAQSYSDDLMGVEGVCSILGITAPTVYALIHNGKLPSYKRGKRLYFSGLRY